MHDLPNLIVTFSYGLGIIGAVAAAGAYSRSSSVKNTVQLQREEIIALQDTNKRQKQEREEFLLERENNLKRIGALEHEVETLKGLISQAPQINALTKEILNQHQEVIGKLSDIATLLVNQNKPRARR